MRNSAFVTRLQSLIDDAKITQTEFARRVMVTHPTVSRWMRGVLPRRTAVDEICRAFGVSKAWLLNGEGDRLVQHSSAESDARYRSLLESAVDMPDRAGATLSEVAFAEYLNEASEIVERYSAMMERLHLLREIGTNVESIASETLRRLSSECNQQISLLAAVKAAPSKSVSKTPAVNGPVWLKAGKKLLPFVANKVEQPSMQRTPALINPSLDELLDAVRRKTDVKGGRQALSDFMGVTQSRLSKWLSLRSGGMKYEPTAANVFKLLQWVNGEQGAQSNKNPAGAVTPTGPLTQRRTPGHEETSSGRHRSSHKKKKRTTES